MEEQSRTMEEQSRTMEEQSRTMEEQSRTSGFGFPRLNTNDSLHGSVSMSPVCGYQPPERDTTRQKVMSLQVC
ncbi:hypothetical protein EYF80_064955 [Liparis tanakae]|uniref:Uncharacterized protein n=1 Tax=Liparis tanakae TaxID=230148 RepID=A0A4Z2E7X4_9TELE|nr:hypothetical protein EYF80_064955 [Liparis tanakae]